MVSVSVRPVGGPMGLLRPFVARFVTPVRLPGTFSHPGTFCHHSEKQNIQRCPHVLSQLGE